MVIFLQNYIYIELKSCETMAILKTITSVLIIHFKVDI
jgi:hypothetical protein